MEQMDVLARIEVEGEKRWILASWHETKEKQLGFVLR